MIRALFLDVDGTLVSFNTHCVPASTREALCEAHRRGVKIIIATGRAAGDLSPLEGIPYDGVVALNGAYCVDAGGDLVGSYPIPVEEFERSLDLGRRYGFPVGLEYDHGVYVDCVTPEVEELARLVAHPVPLQTDLRELFAQDECYQMCFYFDLETEHRVMAELPGLQASRWCSIFADVNVKGVDKASGMTAFMARYGWKPDEVMAFGDGGNDCSMLLAAGIGVAMGNACREALGAADHVTADVDGDGIRQALEYFKVID